MEGWRLYNTVLKRCLFLGAFVLAAAEFCGCMLSNSIPFERNPYASAYHDSRYDIPRPENANYVSTKGKIPIRPADTEEEYLAIVEEGYLPLGSSHLFGRHMGWFHLLQLAGEKRTDLVVINEICGPEHPNETVTDLERMRSACVSGVPPEEEAVPVLRHSSSAYSQTAVLMRKMDLSAMYGAVLGRPLPGTLESQQAKDAEVWVLAVMKGSHAERDGIRRGDRVTAINGRPVRSSADYSNLLYDPLRIRSLKTVHTFGKERVQ